MKKREIFKVEGNKITRVRRHCPKCGDGVFLAEHKNRLSCGSCGYTEFKGKKPEKSQKPMTTEGQPPELNNGGQQPPIAQITPKQEEKAVKDEPQPAEQTT